MMMFKTFLFILVLFVSIEVFYQAANLLVKKLNNIPIPGSVETEEE
jgi:hypothetical protein